MLEDEDVRGMEAGGMGKDEPEKSSSSSSAWRYGFSRPPALFWFQIKSDCIMSELIEARGALSLRWFSRQAAHFFMVSSLRNLMVKFSTPGSPFHQI